MEFSCIVIVKVPSFFAKNQVYHARTKHIDMRLHKIMELVSSSELLLKKIHTSENAADILTKHITIEKFKHCLDLIDLSRCWMGYVSTFCPKWSFQAMVDFLQRGRYSPRWRLLWHVVHIEARRVEKIHERSGA